MMNTETVLKLIENGFTHDEIIAMDKPLPEPKTEPPKEEPKQDVTGQQILEAILALGKQVQSGQAQGARLPELKDITADDVIAQMIRPTGGKKDD